MSTPMFDVPGLKHAAPELSTLSAQQRLTRRQYAALEHGQHPLSVALRTPMPLHADAAPPQDRRADGLRCGGCRFRLHHGPHSFPKCGFGDGVRITNGAGTDLRAWWGACGDYQPAEEDQT